MQEHRLSVNKIVLFLLLSIAWLAGLLFAMDDAVADGKANTARIVSLGGEITEMVHALGLGDNVVAVDTTSTWPEQVKHLPQVGYLRALSAEGVLSMSPDIVIANEEAGPHSVVQQVKNSGVEFGTINKAKDFAGISANLRQLGKLLSREKQAEEVASRLESGAKHFRAQLAGMRKQDGSKPPRVLFLLSAGAGGPMASGRDTSADAMINLVGAINVMQSYSGYKPVSSEAIVASQPDVILMTSRTLGILGGKEAVLGLPGLSATPAGQNNQLVSMDGMYMLGFGPRSVDAAKELASLLW